LKIKFVIFGQVKNIRAKFCLSPKMFLSLTALISAIKTAQMVHEWRRGFKKYQGVPSTFRVFEGFVRIMRVKTLRKIALMQNIKVKFWSNFSNKIF